MVGGGAAAVVRPRRGRLVHSVRLLSALTVVKVVVVEDGWPCHRICLPISSTWRILVVVWMNPACTVEYRTMVEPRSRPPRPFRLLRR